jgi:hypothetical protein
VGIVKRKTPFASSPCALTELAGMEPAVVKTRHHVVRPILYLWITVVPAMVTLVLVDICSQADTPLLAGNSQCRKDVDCPDWKATERAEAMVPLSCGILVETDTPDFYLLLRYRLYLTWALRECNVSTYTRSFQNDAFQLVSYYDGDLQVVRTDVP